jgi:hypothetical protein
MEQAKIFNKSEICVVVETKKTNLFIDNLKNICI